MRASAACIEDNLTPCGAKLCATGTVCLVNGECASEESVHACDTLVDGDVCATMAFEGFCSMGACAPGTCGDGRISDAEQCDGDADIDVDCVEYGFDLGIPACNANCDLDLINSCIRFGWTRVVPEAADWMWANGSDALAFLHVGTHHAEMRSAAGTFVDERDWRVMVGNATTVFAATNDDVIRSQGGAWDDVPGPAIQDFISFGTVAADGTLYLVKEMPCVIKKLPPGGAWTEILNTPTQCNNISPTTTGVLLALESGEIKRYTATSNAWSTEVLDAGAAVLSVIEHRGYLFWGTYGGGIWIREGAQTFEITGDLAQDFFAFGSFLYFNNAEGGYGRIDLDTDIIEILAAPTFGWIYGDAMGGFYVFNNGIYKLSPFAYSEHDGVTQVTQDLELMTDGVPVVATSQFIYIHDNNNSWTEWQTPNTPIALAGRFTDEIFIATSSDPTSNPGADELYYFDGNAFLNESPPSSFTGVADLWLHPETDDLYAVGASALILHDDGGGWLPQTPPAGSSGCNLAAVDGTATVLYAVGECAGVGVVWKQGTGTTWSEVYRAGPPLADVTVTSDGEVVAAGPSGGARTKAGAWGPDVGAKGISIGATTSSDVFVGGGQGEMIRWDGMRWSRMGLVGAIKPRVVATPHAVFIGGASQSVLVR